MFARARIIAVNIGVRRYFFNTTWMMTEQALRLLVGLAVGIYLARFLGPGRYGLYSYAIAFTAIFSAFANLGLDGIVVRNLVEWPDLRGEVLGTAFLLRLIAGLAAFAIILAILPWVENDPATQFYVIIVGAGIILQAFDVIDAYFRSIVEAKYASMCKVAQIVVSASTRLGLIFLQADLVWFVFAVLLDQVTLSLAYQFVSWRKEILPDFAMFTFDMAKKLLRDSWPLIVSGIAIILYIRIDQVMIKAMLGEQQAGVYAAAVRIAEAVYFVPVIVAASLFPRLVSAQRAGGEALRDATLLLLELMSVLAWLAAISFYFLSDFIVATLFGPAFHDAAGVLAVSGWAAVFVFSGVVSGYWMIARNLARQQMITSIVGALLNVLLNLIFIPRYGIVGAAVATLASQAVASLGLHLLFPSTRECFLLQIRAILLPGAHIASLLSRLSNSSEIASTNDKSEYTLSSTVLERYPPY